MNIKALAKEIAKDIKSEKDFSTLSRRFLKLTVEPDLNAHIKAHLEYSKQNPKGKNSGNIRNDYIIKTLSRSLTNIDIQINRFHTGTEVFVCFF